MQASVVLQGADAAGLLGARPAGAAAVLLSIEGEGVVLFDVARQARARPPARYAARGGRGCGCAPAAAA